MGLGIFEVRKELLFIVYLLVVGGMQWLREMRPLNVHSCQLRQPASEARELLEKWMNWDPVECRSPISTLALGRRIRGKSSYKRSNSLQDVSRFCSPEQPRAATVSHNAGFCTENLSYIDLNN